MSDIYGVWKTIFSTIAEEQGNIPRDVFQIVQWRCYHTILLHVLHWVPIVVLCQNTIPRNCWMDRDISYNLQSFYNDLRFIFWELFHEEGKWKGNILCARCSMFLIDVGWGSYLKKCSMVIPSRQQFSPSRRKRREYQGMELITDSELRYGLN